jgi:hypothetical protein
MPLNLAIEAVDVGPTGRINVKFADGVSMEYDSLEHVREAAASFDRDTHHIRMLLICRWLAASPEALAKDAKDLRCDINVAEESGKYLRFRKEGEEPQ